MKKRNNVLTPELMRDLAYPPIMCFKLTIEKEKSYSFDIHVEAVYYDNLDGKNGFIFSAYIGYNTLNLLRPDLPELFSKIPELENDKRLIEIYNLWKLYCVESDVPMTWDDTYKLVKLYESLDPLRADTLIYDLPPQKSTIELEN